MYTYVQKPKSVIYKLKRLNETVLPALVPSGRQHAQVSNGVSEGSVAFNNISMTINAYVDCRDHPVQDDEC